MKIKEKESKKNEAKQGPGSSLATGPLEVESEKRKRGRLNFFLFKFVLVLSNYFIIIHWCKYRYQIKNILDSFVLSYSVMVLLTDRVHFFFAR